jgi:SHS2 domain-containing protein
MRNGLYNSQATMIELFDHTADLGLRVTASTLEELFAEAGQGLLSILVVNPQDVQPVLSRQIELAADDLGWLLFDWLSELLFAFDTEKLLLRQFEIELCGGSAQVAVGGTTDAAAQERRPTAPWQLRALCRGEVCDPRRHAMDHEVKAITYHGLRVERTEQGWLAEVIVDI